MCICACAYAHAHAHACDMASVYACRMHMQLHIAYCV